MKHTPGPWRCEFDIDTRGLSSWRIESETVRTLAALTFVHAVDATTYGMANAKLIAGAAALVEALAPVMADIREGARFDAAWEAVEAAYDAAVTP